MGISCIQRPGEKKKKNEKDMFAYAIHAGKRQRPNQRINRINEKGETAVERRDAASNVHQSHANVPTPERDVNRELRNEDTKNVEPS